MTFDQKWDKFLQSEIKAASGRRLERLKEDLVGEKKMFEEVLWPVFQSFDGFSLEYEAKSISNVTIYVDAFYHPLRFAFESEGFVSHAERITRDRFSFERGRIRSLANYDYKYIPFSWDELDKHADRCRRSVYELLGRYAGPDKRSMTELSIYEREVIRQALRVNRPFRMKDVCFWLGLSADACRGVLRGLMEKELVEPLGEGKQRINIYQLTGRAKNYIL